MQIIPCLFSIVTFIGVNATANHAHASWYEENTIVSQTMSYHHKSQIITYGKMLITILNGITAETADTTENSKPSETLDEILKNDIDSQGVMSNTLGGLAICYNALINILLYPIFSFLLVILSVGAILLAAVFIKKIKDEQHISPVLMVFTGLYLLFYLDLFLVVFQKSKIFFLFLELEKDLILTIVSALIGYTIGKHFSSKTFEEKKLP